MTSLTISFALLLNILGCISLYLSAPNQSWLQRPLSFTTRVLGMMLLLSSLISFSTYYQLVAALFIWLSITMLNLVLLPYSGAMVTRMRNRRHV